MIVLLCHCERMERTVLGLLTLLSLSSSLGLALSGDLVANFCPQGETITVSSSGMSGKREVECEGTGEETIPETFLTLA